MRSSIIHSKEFIESHGVNKPTKKCRVCGIEKDKKDFPRDPGRVDGRYPYCNVCKLSYMKQIPDRRREAARRWREKYPEKERAHVKLNRAVKTGQIIKPKNCQICGKETKRIEGHHWRGYGEKYVLDVQWLCHRCHMDEDIRYKS